MIQEILDPQDRFIAFIMTRESIRLKRAAGAPWPWTDDYILQQYRFTNINRENDRVSIHYQNFVRNHYGVESKVLPATALYRWFNRPETCAYFFPGVFDHYIHHGKLEILAERLSTIPTPHVTGAYIINGAPGYPKGPGVLRYFHKWCQTKRWYEQTLRWQKNPPSLAELFEWLKSDGLGDFMTAQLVADLKYLPFMLQVSDWWTWAAPGPGSMRGLNAVLNRPMNSPWPKGEWLLELNKLQERVMPFLADAGVPMLHAQDLQNCLCEFSKYEKVRTGAGRPRQVFRGAG